MRRTLQSGAIVAAVSAVLLLTGCSAAGSTADLPQKNEARWRLPLDQYQRPLVDPVTDAEQLLIQSCMQEKGYSWSVLVTSVDGKPGESWNPVRRKLFDRELAKKYGYRNSNELAFSAADAQQWTDFDRANRKVGASASTQVDTCLSAARRQIGVSGGRSPYDLAEQLASVAYSDALDSKDVHDAARAWQKCMADVGVPDLPESPTDMPPDSVSAPGGVDYGAAPNQPITVSEEERRVAIADAGCRETTGYSEALYTSEWDAQASAMTSRADDLARYGAEAKKQQRAAEKVVANHAPTNR
jgi:hypothetical protein